MEQLISTERIDRKALVKRGRRLEYITVIWNSLEGFLAVGAGIIAGSIALVGFGVDSVIEVSSGAIILWRLVSGEHRERVALKLVGVSFISLAGYVTFDAVKSVWFFEPPEASYVGIAISVLSPLSCHGLPTQNEKLPSK